MDNTGNTYCIVKTPQAFLYDGPDGTEIADEMLSGWAARILDESTARLKVITHYGYEGWICREAVRSADAMEIKRRDDTGEMRVLTGMFTDIQASPTVHGEILGTYGRGSLVRCTGKADDCYMSVETSDGSRGYMPAVAMTVRKDSDRFLTETASSLIFEELAQDRRNTEGRSKLRSMIAENALKYLGTQYRWGGKNADGIDCSGLTFMSYMLAGILIYRDADIKEGYPVHEISMENIGCGDLLFFKGHVALYLGDRHYIHSTGYRGSCGCVINSLDEADGDYRRDLAEGILHVGSIF